MSIPAGGFVVFNQRDHFGPTPNPTNGFGLSSTGDEAVLTAGQVGSATPLGYQYTLRFAGSDAEVPFGRYTNTTAGEDQPVPLSTLTSGAANSAHARRTRRDQRVHV